MGSSYISVVLPLKLGWNPLYSCSEELERGRLVDVRMGGATYTGVVWESGCALPEGLDAKKVKPILRSRRELPLFSERELKLWKFISDYYLCTLGEVFKAACPSLKINSEKAYSARMERLRMRIRRIEGQLEGRHRPHVEQRLRSELDRLLRELDCLEISLPSPASLAPGEKPVLLVGRDRIEAYRGYIRQCLDNDLQALVLTSEISFCEKMYEALSEEFGHCLYCVHSGKNAGSLQSTSQALRRGAKAVVVGTRSSIFLPWSRLGLCIIDQEQDASLKQAEPSPRYNARDCAVYLASIHGARAVLGSACPSLESILNARSGKYLLVNVPQTGKESNVSFIDIFAERRKRGMVGPISRKLAAAILALPEDRKALLLRGWEDRTVLEESMDSLLHARNVEVVSLPELKRKGADGAALIGVLQIEAFCSDEDFRSDEKAIQMISMLAGMTDKVLVQTAVPSRFTQERSIDSLLEERREFSFPPFTRLVEVRRRSDDSIVERHFLPKDNSLAERKRSIERSLPDDCYIDVDPL